MSEEAKQIKLVYKFNDDYFKIGQLIKITIKDFGENFRDVHFGFIDKVSESEISFISVDSQRRN